MKRETRATLTIAPSLMLASFLAMQGWISFPLTPRVRWFSGVMAVYFIFLWVDWLKRERGQKK